MSDKIAAGTPEVDGQDFMYRQQTEHDFQMNVVAYAKARGWMLYHTRDSRKSPHGFPDLVLVRPPRLVFAELKRERDWRLTPDQGAWLSALEAVSGAVRVGAKAELVQAFLWRPSSWPQIERVLK